MFLARFGQGGEKNKRLVLKERVFGTTQEIEEMWKFQSGVDPGILFWQAQDGGLEGGEDSWWEEGFYKKSISQIFSHIFL